MKRTLLLILSAVANLATAFPSQVPLTVEGSGTDAGAFGNPKVLTSPSNKAGIRAAALGTSGTLPAGVYVVITSTSGTTRVINVTGQALTISNPSGVAGNPTLGAHPKLESIAGLSLTSGMVLMSTGSNTFTGTNEIALSGTATYAGLGKVTGHSLVVPDDSNYLTTDDGSGDALHIAFADTATFAGYGINSNQPVAIVAGDGYVKDDTNLGSGVNVAYADDSGNSINTSYGFITGFGVLVNNNGYAYGDDGAAISTAFADLAGTAQNGFNSQLPLAYDGGDGYVHSDATSVILNAGYADSAGSTTAAYTGGNSGNPLMVRDSSGYGYADTGDPVYVNGAYYIVNADDINNPAASYSTSGGWVGPGIAGGSASTLVGVEFGASQYVLKNNSNITEVINYTDTLVSGSTMIVDASITQNSGVSANIQTIGGSAQTPYLCRAFSGSASIKGAPTDTSTITIIVHVIP